MAPTRGNLLAFRPREPAVETRQEPRQSDFVIPDKWMMTPEGQMALACAEQLQRQRMAFEELHRFENKLGITG